MKTKIALCDSGVGGIAVLMKLTKKYPGNHYLYISDSSNFPYGNKDLHTVERLCYNNVLIAKKWGCDILIVACNTMSVCGRKIFEKYCDFPVFYVQPNYEKIVNEEGKNSILFCTELTAKITLKKILSNKFFCTVYPMKNLALQIEKNIFDLEKEKYVFFSETYRNKVEKVYLGCTHYIHLSSHFARNFPNATIDDGTEVLIEMLKEYLNTNESSALTKLTFKGSGQRRMKKVFFYLQNGQKK